MVAGSALKVARSEGGAFVWRNNASSNACLSIRASRGATYMIHAVKAGPWARSLSGPTNS